MSVLKSKRKASQFEVFHHLYKLRREITDLLLRDFGYSYEKGDKRLVKMFGGRNYTELTETEQERYDRLKQKYASFDDWFVYDERQVIVDCLREITKEVFIANSIYPTCYEELVQRRLHQDEAIGQCYRLAQELQYAIETLPVDVNAYLRFGEMIQTEINPKRLTTMRRKMKKLVHKLSEKEFDDLFKSWFQNHYRIMSKRQRENMNSLYEQLKKEGYSNVHNHTT